MSGSPSGLNNAIDQDCQRILSAYAELQTVRFAQFAEKWREINFVYAHCAVKDGRDKQDRDRHDLTISLLTCASKYLSSDYPFEVRIGSLYLLYCLYFTQLSDPKAKIRLDPVLLEDLSSLHHKITSDKHSDADYILRRLKEDYAFHIVATLTQMSMRYHATVPTHTEELELFLRDDHSYINLLFSTNTLQAFHQVHSEYEEIKSLISQQHPSLFSSSHKDLPEKLYSDIQAYIDWRVQHRNSLAENKEHEKLHLTPLCKTPAKKDAEKAVSPTLKEVVPIKTSLLTPPGKPVTPSAKLKKTTPTKRTKPRMRMKLRSKKVSRKRVKKIESKK
ncbi:hypothetical protein LOD99_220 [Oopsacas minuta]|uniref:snRNA-activating protein complex subunit 1 n=1 Tax=Oopsacas minuta TaxID=111878 RepID=A0AAV7KA04_9METZ|nr:hypothetical protein LOD99_220 [Oopsacas minuta]